MPNRLLTTILYSCLFALLAGGSSLITGVSNGQVEVVKSAPTSSETISVQVKANITSFMPWQRFSGGKFGLVGAKIEITEYGSKPYVQPDSGRITLVRANGEHLVTAKVEYKSGIIADNRTQGPKYSDWFEMMPTRVAR